MNSHQPHTILEAIAQHYQSLNCTTTLYAHGYLDIYDQIGNIASIYIKQNELTLLIHRSTSPYNRHHYNIADPNCLDDIQSKIRPAK